MFSVSRIIFNAKEITFFLKDHNFKEYSLKDKCIIMFDFAFICTFSWIFSESIVYIIYYFNTLSVILQYDNCYIIVALESVFLLYLFWICAVQTAAEKG